MRWRILYQEKVLSSIWQSVGKSFFTKVCADAWLLKKILFDRVKCPCRFIVML